MFTSKPQNNALAAALIVLGDRFYQGYDADGQGAEHRGNWAADARIADQLWSLSVRISCHRVGGFDLASTSCRTVLAAAVMRELELILMKMPPRRESPFQIPLLKNSLGLLIASIAVFAVWLARADASFVARFSYATLIFTALYDAVFFVTLPGAVTWVGASIIIAGAVLLAMREARRKPQPVRAHTSV